MRVASLVHNRSALAFGAQLRAINTSAETSFYRNRALETYAEKPTTRLTLRQLVFYGRAMNEERLIKSANHVRTELPIRLAHRIRDMQSLPYVVVTQEQVAKVYELYWSAFGKFRSFPPITNLDENDQFCTFATNLLREHLPVIGNLFLGLSLASPYMQPEALDSFMRRMLVSRISRRVLVQHHIALSDSLAGRDVDNAQDHVGIIYTRMNVRECIERCASLLKQQSNDMEADVAEDPGFNTAWPELIVDGHTETRFSYIREHAEYIIFELLKNAVRSTRLKYRNFAVPPPIRATVVAGSDDIHIRISDQGGGLPSTTDNGRPIDLFSFSHARNEQRMSTSRLDSLRSLTETVGGVVTATVEEQIQHWKRRESDASLSLRQAIHPRLGLGLPMSNVFARYFGGSLDLVSLDGWGTDVYLRLPKLGTNLEGIEV